MESLGLIIMNYFIMKKFKYWCKIIFLALVELSLCECEIKLEDCEGWT